MPNPAPQSPSQPSPASPDITGLLKQPPQTSAYWRGRWLAWQQARLKTKAKTNSPK